MWAKNEHAHALLTEYTRSVAKALWLTERDSTALRYHINWTYGELCRERKPKIQTRTLENHANLLAYLTN